MKWKYSISSLVLLFLVLELWPVMWRASMPFNGPVLAQSADLERANGMAQQVIFFFHRGKYAEAIPWRN